MNNSQQALQNTFGTQYVIAAHKVVEHPIISIVIPTKNCLHYLPKAIKSIQIQNISDIEILILDDNSTDETWHYLTQAAKCDQRIKPIKIIGEGGVSKVRNRGLSKARSQYIAFLDADDQWLPRKLSSQLAFHQSNLQVSLSFCNYIHVNEQNQDLGTCFDYWPTFKKYTKKNSTIDYQIITQQGAAIIYAENVIGTSGVMINTHTIKTKVNFDEKLKNAEDWDCWLKIALNDPIGFTNSADFVYLMRSNSESSNMKLRLMQMQKIMRRHAMGVFKINPVALIRCSSRLLMGYAEYYKTLQISTLSIAGNITNACQVFLCHSLAFMLSPSIFTLKAVLSDIKSIVISTCSVVLKTPEFKK